jgi:N utilization substance protein B
VLRIATFELLGRPEVPTAVVLNEAVGLAKRYGTDDSGKFVNGMLSAIARTVRGGASPAGDGTKPGDDVKPGDTGIATAD